MLHSVALVLQGAITGHEDPSSIIVLVEGGQLLLYDLTATTGQQPAKPPSPPPGKLTEQRSGSPSKHRASAAAAVQQQLKQQPQPQDGTPAPPVVQQLFKGQLQGKPLVTAARFRMIPIQPVPLRGLQGASMNGLREWAASSKQAQRAAADKQSWAWVVQGGCPALPDSSSTAQRSTLRVHAGHTASSSSSYATLYCTGHSDGAVRLWDMHGQVPQLLGTVPSSAAAHALSSIRKTKASAVCTLEFAWEQGLLISGHEGGEVSTLQSSGVVAAVVAVVSTGILINSKACQFEQRNNLGTGSRQAVHISSSAKVHMLSGVNCCCVLQVRMYQFSATPKHIECVVFESVGGRDSNQGLGIKVCFTPSCVAASPACTVCCLPQHAQVAKYALPSSSVLLFLVGNTC